VTSADDRERLRWTFESAVDLYQRARPEYPAALFDHLAAVAGLHRGDHLLEIGCASGKATLPLAERGYRITAIELGPELAAAARHNLSAYPDVQVINATFEGWTPPSTAFDLAFAATAWHWVDPTLGYSRAHDALRAGGHLAIFGATHVFPDGGDSFFREIQPIYDEIGEPAPPSQGWPRPGELPDDRAEIEQSGCFDVVDMRHFDWETVYDAEGYIELLDTFSGHIAMEQWQRDRLYGAIRDRLGARPDGRVRRHWGAVLQVARRRD